MQYPSKDFFEGFLVEKDHDRLEEEDTSALRQTLMVYYETGVRCATNREPITNFLGVRKVS